tara:strand:- start:102 stop:227 length:126 start_codon:yes stop_codon:yes gene_type:complete
MYLKKVSLQNAAKKVIINVNAVNTVNYKKEKPKAVKLLKDV